MIALRSKGLANLRFAMMSAAVLLICGALLAAVNEQAARSAKGRDTAIKADILAGSVSAALAFDDRGSAKAYVDALQADPELLAVAVYDSRGSLFAGFHRG